MRIHVQDRGSSILATIPTSCALRLRLRPPHPLVTLSIQQESPRHIGHVGDFVVSQMANLSLGQVTNVLDSKGVPRSSLHLGDRGSLVAYELMRSLLGGDGAARTHLVAAQTNGTKPDENATESSLCRKHVKDAQDSRATHDWDHWLGVFHKDELINRIAKQ